MAFLWFLLLVAILMISLFLWKSGFLQIAENPKTLLDKPVTDEKQRKAFMKRLKRWKEEGRISRTEYERFSLLCDTEWDQPTD